MRYSILFLFLALGTVFPHVVQGITLNLDYPQFGPFDLNTTQSLPEIIGFFYYFIVGIGGLAAFVMLVWGGVQWLTSGAIPSQAGEARDRIKNAIVGLLLILASFLVIQIINPELTIIRGKPLVDPCSDPANAAKCTPAAVIAPVVGGGGLGGGTVTVTVSGQPSILIPFPATTVFLEWSTTMLSSLCTATTDSSPFNSTIVGQWNYPVGSAPKEGNFLVDLSSATDGTRVEFTFTCVDGSNPAVEQYASVIVGSGGGVPPVITQFEVQDWNDSGSAWLPGGIPGSGPVYECCGSFPQPTDFPVSSDIRVRWNSTNATECFGENSLTSYINGGSISIGGVVQRPFVSQGVYTFTLKCKGNTLPDAVQEMIINRFQ